ncbi:hypothetical protein F4810DRAFT_698481 [Camillea tinctor]|nr:hypothetical protein F4810DRAFT_698481 [Camillea tinctor]
MEPLLLWKYLLFLSPLLQSSSLFFQVSCRLLFLLSSPRLFLLPLRLLNKADLIKAVPSPIHPRRVHHRGLPRRPSSPYHAAHR